MALMRSALHRQPCVLLLHWINFITPDFLIRIDNFTELVRFFPPLRILSCINLKSDIRSRRTYLVTSLPTWTYLSTH